MNKFFPDNKIAFIIIPFIIFITTKVLKFPVYIDEATTYLEYTSQGFWTTISSYQEPNNHVLFSIILVLFQKLPIDILYAMRIPNILISVFTIWTLNRYLKTKYSSIASLFGTTIFAFSYAILYYSIFARGYLLIILCCLITFINLDEIEKSYSVKKLVSLGLITVIGFFTIPIYLYVTLTFVIIILIRFWKKKDILLKLFITGCSSGVATLILYSPIIYKNGIKSIVSNDYNTPKSSPEIYFFLKNSWIGFYDKIWGIQSGIIISCMILYTLYLLLMLKKDQRTGYEFIIFITLPFIFVLIQKVIPGFRTWTYLIIPIVLITTSLVEKILSNVRKKLIIMFSILTITSCILTQLYIFNKSNPFGGHLNDVEANKIATYLIKNHNVKDVNFIDGRKDYDAVIYLFEQKRKKLKNKILFIPNSQRNTLNIIESKKYKNNSKHMIVKKFRSKLIYTI